MQTLVLIILTVLGIIKMPTEAWAFAICTDMVTFIFGVLLGIHLLKRSNK